MAVLNVFHFGAFFSCISIAMAAACTPYCSCWQNSEADSVSALCKFPNSTTFQKDISELPANLSELHLVGSLGNITEGMFSNLTFSNGLTKMFWWLTQIESVEAGSFKGLSNLTTLSFAGTSLTTIPTGLLDGVAKLQELHFNQHQNVTSVPSGVFSAGACVESIEFTNNAIETLADETFKNASSCLVTLNLENNKIKEISNATFTELLKLETLSLSSNKNMNISSAGFGSLSRLKSLKLDSVFGSDTLPTDVFRGLDKLRSLSIQDGGLKTFTPEDFQPIAKLEKIDLSGNRIETFPGTALANLTSLKELRLVSNSAGTGAGMVITLGAFSPFSELTTLDMNGTRIAQPDGGVFKGLTSLTTLNLDQSSLEVITPGMFSGLQNLSSLSLDSNKLITLPNDLFKGLTSLNMLSLAHNRISRIEDNAFAGLGNLNALRLDYNSLTTLAVACLKPVAATEVFLHDNPWDCTCDLDPLRTWIKENHNFTADVRCVTPSGLKGKFLVKLTHEEVCSEPSEYVDVGLYVGIAFVVLFLILVVTGAIIYFYQKRKQGTNSRERLT
ncbi:platelet glycoprotein V-like [Lineus longissimus]|uniref:platelet glycoprotein V-like n=1 Tax=Lineus longissimus TaxID=88925 RepID=UPI00315DA76F